MSEKPMTEALLRHFLLGTLDDEERQRIETRFMTDPVSRERILAAEQDLFEDYLEEALETADRERFLLQYADTPEQRQKLRITRSVKEWATREANLTQDGRTTVSIWSRLRDGLRVRPVFVIPLAITAMIVIVFAAVWLNRRTEQRNKLLAVKQEITRLNDPSSLRQTPAQMSALVLSPVSVRSVEKESEFVRRTDEPFVELRLLWFQKENYPTYQAVIRWPAGNESHTIPNLYSDSDGTTIRMRLPTHFLTPGSYQIELCGIDAGGTPGPSEEYKFTVSG
jgi:hypothetical protein